MSTRFLLSPGLRKQIRPGGLITSEALACSLMMVGSLFAPVKVLLSWHVKCLHAHVAAVWQVVVDPYPGQEERNASMLLEEGAGTSFLHVIHSCGNRVSWHFNCASCTSCGVGSFSMFLHMALLMLQAYGFGIIETFLIGQLLTFAKIKIVPRTPTTQIWVSVALLGAVLAAMLFVSPHAVS